MYSPEMHSLLPRIGCPARARREDLVVGPGVAMELLSRSVAFDRVCPIRSQDENIYGPGTPFRGPKQNALSLTAARQEGHFGILSPALAVSGSTMSRGMSWCDGSTVQSWIAPERMLVWRLGCLAPTPVAGGTARCLDCRNAILVFLSM